MPQAYEVDIHWTEKFAWWPVHSTWSKKRIWLKKYHIGVLMLEVYPGSRKDISQYIEEIDVLCATKFYAV